METWSREEKGKSQRAEKEGKRGTGKSNGSRRERAITTGKSPLEQQCRQARSLQNPHLSQTAFKSFWRILGKPGLGNWPNVTTLPAEPFIRFAESPCTTLRDRQYNWGHT